MQIASYLTLRSRDLTFSRLLRPVGSDGEVIENDWSPLLEGREVPMSPDALSRLLPEPGWGVEVFFFFLNILLILIIFYDLSVPADISIRCASISWRHKDADA